MTSGITVSGGEDNAPAALRVSIGIKRIYRGDLAIDPAGPQGAAVRLKTRVPAIPLTTCLRSTL
jgi:hypothetical protein